MGNAPYGDTRVHEPQNDTFFCACERVCAARNPIPIASIKEIKKLLIYPVNGCAGLIDAVWKHVIIRLCVCVLIFLTPSQIIEFYFNLVKCKTIENSMYEKVNSCSQWSSDTLQSLKWVSIFRRVFLFFVVDVILVIDIFYSSKETFILIY